LKLYQEILDLLHFLILFQRKVSFFLSKKICLLDWFTKKSYPNLLLILCVVISDCVGVSSNHFVALCFHLIQVCFISSL
jgi:hypothetical protein